MRRRGQFSWNRGGWFGGQVGASAWMGLLGVLMVPISPALALVALLGCAIPNVLGSWLWAERQRFEPHLAFQALAAVSGLCALAVVSLFDYAGQLHELGSGYNLYWVLLVYPAVMAQIYFLARANRRS